MCHSLISSLEDDGTGGHGGKLHPNKVALSMLVIRNIPGRCHSQNHGGVVGAMPVCMCQGQCQQLKSRDVTAASLALPAKEGWWKLIYIAFLQV